MAKPSYRIMFPHVVVYDMSRPQKITMRRHFLQENPALISPVDGESEEKPVLAKEAAKEVKEEDARRAAR